MVCYLRANVGLDNKIKKTLLIISVIVFIFACMFCYKYFRNRAFTEIKVENTIAQMVNSGGFENREREIIYLNEVYENFKSLSYKKPPKIKKYTVDMQTISVIKGKREKKSDYIQFTGKEIVLGIWGIGDLVKNNGLSCIDMKMLSGRDIRVNCFVVHKKKRILDIIREFFREIFVNRYGDLSFQVVIPRSQKFRNVSIDFLQRNVHENFMVKGIVLRIFNRNKKTIQLNIRDMYFIDRYNKKIETFPSVDYFKFNKQWIKSVFIPSGTKARYIFNTRHKVIFSGYLGSSPGNAIEYQIRINDKLLLKTKVEQGLKYFMYEINPDNKKLDLEIRANGDENSIGILGNFSFYKKNFFRENIILYLIDALRADYGGVKEALLEDSFENSAIFKNAYSNATKTADSLPVIFSGKYKFMLVDYRKDSPFLPKSEFLLAEYLKKKGYTTVAFITNPWLIQNNAIQGFDFVYLTWNETNMAYSLFPSKQQYKNMKYGELEEVLNHFLKNNSDKPLFIYLHTIEPHIPYELPIELRRYSKGLNNNLLESVYNFKYKLTNPKKEQIEALKSLYKDEVLSALKFFKKVRQKFKEVDVLSDDTLLILTSDHGERFFEHGSSTHGTPDVYNEVLRIPLVISGKGVKPGIYDVNVQLADIYPTIMDWLESKDNGNDVGDSLLRFTRGDVESFRDRVIYSDGAVRKFQFSYIKNNIKVIIDDDQTEIYDLHIDPEERSNLFNRMGFHKLIKEARNFRNNFHIVVDKDRRIMSVEERKRLKSLGYITE